MCSLLLTDLASFVEYESAGDLRAAVEKLDGREFKGQRVTCVANVRITSLSQLLVRLDAYLQARHSLSLLMDSDVSGCAHGLPAVAATLDAWTTMIAAALLVEAVATALVLPATAVTGMTTVLAAPAVTTITTVAVATDRHLLHVDPSTTILLPEAATMTPTGRVTTLLLSRMSMAAHHTSVVLLLHATSRPVMRLTLPESPPDILLATLGTIVVDTGKYHSELCSGS